MVAKKLVVHANLLYFMLCYGYCQENNYNSLLITKIGDKLELTKPFEYDKDQEKANYKSPGVGQVYQFCSQINNEQKEGDKSSDSQSESVESNQDKKVLDANDTAKREKLIKHALYMDRSFKTQEIFHDADKCKSRADPVFVQVKNPGKIKSHWDTEVELYHSGYLLYTKDVKGKSVMSNVLQWFNPMKYFRPENKEIRPEYELLDSNYEIILGLEIHFSKIYRQVVAVEYELLSTPIIDSLKDNSYREVYPHGHIPSFIRYIENNEDQLFLDRKVGRLWHKYLQDFDGMGNLIYDETLAPFSHFPVPIWRYPAQIWANEIPLWYPVVSRLENIASFVRYVAEHLGDLKVSVGVAGIMSLPGVKNGLREHSTNGSSGDDGGVLDKLNFFDSSANKSKYEDKEKEDKSEASVVLEHSSQNEGQDVSRRSEGKKNSSAEEEAEKQKSSSRQEESSKDKEEGKESDVSNHGNDSLSSEDLENTTTTVLLEEKENNFRMPNYYWAAYEFNDGKTWYGIFVVMNCNPFVDTPNACEDVCHTNGWPLSNQNFKEGEIYCCDMTDENIYKLEAQFLLNKKREPFNLHNWKEKRELILTNTGATSASTCSSDLDLLFKVRQHQHKDTLH